MEGRTSFPSSVSSPFLSLFRCSLGLSPRTVGKFACPGLMTLHWGRSEGAEKGAVLGELTVAGLSLEPCVGPGALPSARCQQLLTSSAPFSGVDKITSAFQVRASSGTGGCELQPDRLGARLRAPRSPVPAVLPTLHLSHFHLPDFLLF